METLLYYLFCLLLLIKDTGIFGYILLKLCDTKRQTWPCLIGSIGGVLISRTLAVEPTGG